MKWNGIFFPLLQDPSHYRDKHSPSFIRKFISQGMLAKRSGFCLVFLAHLSSIRVPLFPALPGFSAIIMPLSPFCSCVPLASMLFLFTLRNPPSRPSQRDGSPALPRSSLGHLRNLPSRDRRLGKDRDNQV